jgi:two-component system LytT family response regulator
MTAIIIDDVQKARAHLKTLLVKHCKHVKILGEASNAESGAALILEYKPELVFLDIQMPKQSGFDMLASLGIYEFDVIFVTGYDQYGIQALKASALDYLLKPVKHTELIAAVNKAQGYQNNKQTASQIANLLDLIQNPHKTDPRIALHSIKGIQFINPYEISHCEADDNYTNVFLEDGRKIISTNVLRFHEELLADFGFIRPHHSYIVNVKQIKGFAKGSVVHELRMNDDFLVPVSSRKVKEIREALI